MSQQNTNTDTNGNKKELTFAEKFGKKKSFSSTQVDKENINKTNIQSLNILRDPPTHRNH